MSTNLKHQNRIESEEKKGRERKKKEERKKRKKKKKNKVKTKEGEKSTTKIFKVVEVLILIKLALYLELIDHS